MGFIETNQSHIYICRRLDDLNESIRTNAIQMLVSIACIVDTLLRRRGLIGQEMFLGEAVFEVGSNDWVGSLLDLKNISKYANN